MKSRWEHYIFACEQIDLAFPRWSKAARARHHFELSSLDNDDQDMYVERLIAAKNRRLTVFFLCDRKSCSPGSCEALGCSRTSDITHAKNFKKIGPSKYIEIEEDLTND